MKLVDRKRVQSLEDQNTEVPLNGFISVWNKSKPLQNQTLETKQIETQWLDEHTVSARAVQAVLQPIAAKVDTKEGLKELQRMIIFDIRVLMGADYPWPAPAAECQSGDGAGHGSDHEKRADDESPALTSGQVGDDDDDVPLFAGRKATGSKGGPCGPVILDSTDFTTWSPDTWQMVQWENVKFVPGDNHRQNKLFHACSIVFFYDDVIRKEQPRVYTELQNAWQEQYGRPANSSDLEAIPNAGPGRFSDEEMKWCHDTVNSFRRSSARKRQAPATPATSRNASESSSSAPHKRARTGTRPARQETKTPEATRSR